ncbi:MAG: DUF2142 domain-containing protein [Acidimicrobiaceae bacterium]
MKFWIQSHTFASLFLSFFFLIAVWSTLTPLFSGPDEPASYIRGAAIVRGQFTGTDIAPSETTAYWSTYVDIPQQFGVAQLVPWCFVGKPDVPACSQPLESLTPVEDPRTDMGRYPPTGYFFGGLGSLIGATDLSVYLSRIFNALVSSVFFALAIKTWRDINRSPISILAAISPGVIFASSVISASALEISAATCMWASSYAWMKQNSKLNSFSIIASGTILALARPTGPIYLLIAVFLVFFSTPPSESSKSFAKRSKNVILILGTSTLLAVVWQLFIYSHNLDKSYVEEETPNLFEIIQQSLNDITRKIAESIGNFGWLDTPAPTIVIWCFVVFSAIAVFRTWQTMTFRHRAAISVLPLITISMMVYLNWSTQKHGGNFGVQGRHLTPLIVGIPILGGLNWSPSVSTKKLFLVTWSGCIFVSGLIALRRYSVGVKQFNFFEMFTKPVWTPPLGIASSIFALAIALLALSMTIFVTANKEVEHAG